MAFTEGPVTHSTVIGEGRRSSSRSSSRGSDTSPRVRKRPPSPESGDEAVVPAISAKLISPEQDEGDAPLVRPPLVSAWGGTAFGSFQSHSSSQFTGNTATPQTAVSQSRTAVASSVTLTVAPGTSTSQKEESATEPTDEDVVYDTPPTMSTEVAGPFAPVSSNPRAQSVPTSLHDFTSPQPITQTSTSSTVSFMPGDAASSTSFHIMSPSVSVSSITDIDTQGKASGRGRGGKRGTKPGSKRGEWRVKNYMKNNLPISAGSQAADFSTFNSSFRLSPGPTQVAAPVETAPTPQHERTRVEEDVHCTSAERPASVTRPSPPVQQEAPLQHSSTSHEFTSEMDDHGASDMVFEEPLVLQRESHLPHNPQSNNIQGPTPRLLAIVIDDKHEGCDDLQLAEVTVPVRETDKGFFWVQAEDVCPALQAGPSRIDGPAKVYAYRGQYRQYFLRVSADNQDSFGPANLSITSKRVLKVFVDRDIPSRVVAINPPFSGSSGNGFASQSYPHPAHASSSYSVAPIPPGSGDYSRSSYKRNYEPIPYANGTPAPAPFGGSSTKRPRRHQNGDHS